MSCEYTKLFQVIIEYLEESPDASYEDLLNKIEVGIKLNCACIQFSSNIDHSTTS